MSQDQMLLTVLGVLVLANVSLLAAALLQTRDRRPSRDGRRDPAAGEDAHAAAAIEAFVADLSAEATGRARPPTPAAVIARRREVLTAPIARRREVLTAPAPERRPDAPAWTPVGLADPAMWDRSVREESARLARFGRPVTVVMAELHQVDDVADRFGRDVADRVVTETSRLLMTHGRAADRIAWLGDARFGVLLMETDETRACGYVDRVRAVADGWLESAGLSVRLSLGWASPSPGGDIMAAVAVARQRMVDGALRTTAERR